MYTSEFENVKIALDTILERDMDLLIIEELLNSRDFLKMFLKATEIDENSELIEIKHSVRFESGETDIFVAFKTFEGKIIDLHIEDKINAEAQPEQFSRYEDRAKKLCKNHGHNEYRICMTAPRWYLENNSEAQKYHSQISYEEIYNYFSEQNDARAKYKLALINCALGKKDTVIAVPNEEVTSFWNELDKLAAEKGLKISTKESQHGKESKFIRFKTRYKGVFVIYKARHGNIDLQLPNPLGKITFPQEAMPTNVSVCNFKQDVALRISDPRYILNLEENISCNKEIVEEILNRVKEQIELCEKLVNAYPNIIR